jgi:hypothetical protein
MNVKLNSLHLVLILRMCGTLPQHPLYIFVLIFVPFTHSPQVRSEACFKLSTLSWPTKDTHVFIVEGTVCYVEAEEASHARQVEAKEPDYMSHKLIHVSGQISYQG